MNIVCILGKSGSGKSTIEKFLEQLGYNRIISYTTRKPRGNEENGVEYHFVTKDEFNTLLNKGILIEHTEYNGNLYGIPKPVGSINNVAVVETEGYLKIQELYGRQVVGVYVDTPDEVIEERLSIRNDTHEKDRGIRSKEDSKRFNGIESKVDIVIDGRQPPCDSAMQILLKVKALGLR